MMLSAAGYEDMKMMTLSTHNTEANFLKWADKVKYSEKNYYVCSPSFTFAGLSVTMHHAT